MVIVSGKAYVPADRREEYLAAQKEFIARVRQQAGCLDVYIVADPLESGRINVFELWASEAEMRAFQAVAQPPQTGIDFFDDDVLLYEIRKAGPVFPE